MIPTNASMLSPRLFAVVAGALLFATPVVHAEAEDTDDEDVVTLSPFEVRATEAAGYRVTDTNTATRINLNLADIPYNITVLGREFLDDIGARESNDVFAAESSTNEPTPFIQIQSTRPTIRGTSSSRFYVDGVFYNSLIAPDGATDRVEILKGPAGMLFGQAEPGGSINYILKQARAKPVGKLDTYIGSYEEYGAGVDWGGPLGDSEKFLSRVSVNFSRKDNDWIDYLKTENLDLYSRLRYQYAPGSFVQGTFMYSQRDIRGIPRPMGNVPGYGNISPIDANVFESRFRDRGLPDPEEAGFVNLALNLHNPDSFADMYTVSYWAEWTHDFEKWGTLRVVGNLNHMRRDGWRPGISFTVPAYGQINTHQSVLDEFNDGQPLVTELGDFLYVASEDLRLSNLYGRSIVANWMNSFAFGRVRYRTVLGADWTFEQFTDRRFRSRWHYELNPATGLSRFKVNNRQFRPVLGNVFRPEEGIRRITPPLETYDVPDGRFDNSVKGPGIYTFNFLDFYDGRLLVSLAGRYDRYSAKNRTFRMDREPDAADYARIEANQGDSRTWSGGAVYNINQYVGVFGGWSTSFRPLVSVLRDRNGEQFQPEPTTGRGGDAGIRLSLLNDRLTVMTSIFKTSRTNLPQLVSEVTEQGFVVNYDVQSGVEETRGFELEGVGEITKNFQIRLGWTYLDTEVVRNQGNPNLVGQRLAASPRNKIVITPRYTFTEGRLENLTVGFQMTAILDDVFYPSAPRDPLELRPAYEGHTVVNPFVHYTFRVTPNVRARIQLNIFNVFSEKYTSSRPMGPIRGRITATFIW